MSCLSPSQASINFIPAEYYKVGSQTARTILRHSQGAIDRVPPDQQPVSISTAALALSTEKGEGLSDTVSK
jgi:hypothetical protein